MSLKADGIAAGYLADRLFNRSNDTKTRVLPNSKEERVSRNMKESQEVMLLSLDEALSSSPSSTTLAWVSDKLVHVHRFAFNDAPHFAMHTLGNKQSLENGSIGTPDDLVYWLERFVDCVSAKKARAVLKSLLWVPRESLPDVAPRERFYRQGARHQGQTRHLASMIVLDSRVS